VEIGSTAVRRLPAPGPNFSPVWSPDGQTLAFKTFLRSEADEYHTYNLGYVAVVSAAGGPVRLLSDRFDENASSTSRRRHRLTCALRASSIR